MIGHGPKEGLSIGRFGDTRWDDLAGSLIAARLDIASGRLHYDYFNGGVIMDSNARYPDKPIVMALQFKHAMRYGAGAVLRPHLHWLQQQSAMPNFLIGYKKVAQGAATTFEVDFSNFTLLHIPTNVFTYTSGTLVQITKFAEIDASDLNLSSQVTFVLFRDTANVSGLFSGVDPVAADVTVLYQDQHVLLDSTGSSQEYAK